MLANAILDFEDTSTTAVTCLLVPLADFYVEVGFATYFEVVDLPMVRTTYSVPEKCTTILFSIAGGCPSTYAINTHLGPQVPIANRVGMSRFPDQSTINDLYRALTEDNLVELDWAFKSALRDHSLAWREPQVGLLVDLDVTGLIANGDSYQFAEPGYFPQGKGNQGYHLSAAIVSNEKPEVMAHFLDPANLYAGHRFCDLIYEVGEALPQGDLSRLFIRGDREYGTGSNVEFCIDHRIGFLFKGRDSRTARRWVCDLSQDQIRWIPIYESKVWVADIGLQQIPNCRYKARVILIRRIKDGRYAYSYLVTSIPLSWLDAVGVFHFYNRRVIIESLFKTAKGPMTLANLRTASFVGIRAFVLLVFLTHNLLTWFHREVLAPDPHLDEVTVSELITTFAHVAVAVEKIGDRFKFYLATCSQKVKQLFLAAVRWIERLSRLSPRFCSRAAFT